MASGYTFFSTYVLVPTSGNTEAIHCNYINSLQLNSANVFFQEISMAFPSAGDFKFLSNGIIGTGYTANKLYAVIQLVSNAPFAKVSDVRPVASGWTIVDLTPQISGFTGFLTPTNLTSRVFKIPLFGYSGYTKYNLQYLNYPTKLPVDDADLCFGDEMYFLGNVGADIHADVYVTNLSINLPLAQFNTSTNTTWVNLLIKPPVAMTEVAIYDGNNNIVAIGKFNDPVLKDQTLSRTIVFNIDF
jgi:hypothetical protein